MLRSREARVCCAEKNVILHCRAYTYLPGVIKRNGKGKKKIKIQSKKKTDRVLVVLRGSIKPFSSARRRRFSFNSLPRRRCIYIYAPIRVRYISSRNNTRPSPPLPLPLSPPNNGQRFGGAINVNCHRFRAPYLPVYRRIYCSLTPPSPTPLRGGRYVYLSPHTNPPRMSDGPFVSTQTVCSYLVRARVLCAPSLDICIRYAVCVAVQYNTSNI